MTIADIYDVDSFVTYDDAVAAAQLTARETGDEMSVVGGYGRYEVRLTETGDESYALSRVFADGSIWD